MAKRHISFLFVLPQYFFFRAHATAYYCITCSQLRGTGHMILLAFRCCSHRLIISLYFVYLRSDVGHDLLQIPLYLTGHGQ